MTKSAGHVSGALCFCILLYVFISNAMKMSA